VTRHRHYDITETYRSTQAEFDDRGIIYIRHGPPDDRAAYLCPPPDPADPNPPTCATNESWRYRRAEGDVVYHFAARDDVQDYKLVESLVDVLGFSASVAAQGRRDTLVADLYATRERFGEPYSRVWRGHGLRSNVLGEERQLGRRAIAAGHDHRQLPPPFDRPLTVRTTDFVVARRTATIRRSSSSWCSPCPSGDSRRSPPGAACGIRCSSASRSRTPGEGSCRRSIRCACLARRARSPARTS
jgi:hypothetical protein